MLSDFGTSPIMLSSFWTFTSPVLWKNSSLLRLLILADELDPAGLLPERPFTKVEILTYLEHCRRKCREVVENLTEQKARERCAAGWLDLSVAELLLYNMRHIQHHAAQLNLILRQATASAPRWVAKSKVALSNQ